MACIGVRVERPVRLVVGANLVNLHIVFRLSFETSAPTVMLEHKRDKGFHEPLFDHVGVPAFDGDVWWDIF
jgi:hypothetical protein